MPYIYEVIYPEIAISDEPVIDSNGIQWGQGQSDIDTWRAWQKAVQEQFRGSDYKSIPRYVMDYFQATKQFSRPPRKDEVDPVLILDRFGARIEIKKEEKELKSKNFSWSYTALCDYENCPHAYAETRVFKRVTKERTQEMIGGELGHKDLESYLKGAGLTDRIRPYKMYAEGIMNCPKDKLLVEEQIAIDKGLKIVDWFSPFAWGRGIIDVAIIKGTTALIYDWKFGRRKLDDLQLKIFCFFLALKYPDIEKFESSFIYLKEENPADAVVSLKGGFTREDLVNVWLEIEPRVKRMEDAFNTSIFSKKTSGLCHGWCAVTECTHWSERRKKCK